MAVVPFSSKPIDVSALRKNTTRRLTEGLIAPATEEVEEELAVEHAAEPIKSLDDIAKISEYLISQKRYRDNMLFIVGINFGLRVSDLRVLRFSNLINESYVFRDSFPVFEKKTRNTRKKKRNRYITVNDAVIEAVTLYLENTPGVTLSDYMFKSESNNGKGGSQPLSVRSIDRMLKGVAADLGLGCRISTHSLRKTFGYHQMMMCDNDNRKLLVLQKMFGHSTPSQTLDYIGITNEEIEAAYKNLNLGSKTNNYLVNSRIVEYEQSTG